MISHRYRISDSDICLHYLLLINLFTINIENTLLTSRDLTINPDKSFGILKYCVINLYICCLHTIYPGGNPKEYRKMHPPQKKTNARHK